MITILSEVVLNFEKLISLPFVCRHAALSNYSLLDNYDTCFLDQLALVRNLTAILNFNVLRACILNFI